MYCIKCGCELPEEGKFCPQCGNLIKSRDGKTAETNVHSAETKINAEKNKKKGLIIAVSVLVVAIAIFTVVKFIHSTTKPHISDGEYYVQIYPSSIDNEANALKFKVAQLVEISDNEANNLQVGDVLYLPEVDLEISITAIRFEYNEEIDCNELWINGGEYICYYMYESATWIVAFSDGEAMVYTSEECTLPLSDNVMYFDYRTPYGIGMNVYGESLPYNYDESSSVFRLDDLFDYFAYYSLDSEYAIIKVLDGEITEVRILYRA